MLVTHHCFILVSKKNQPKAPVRKETRTGTFRGHNGAADLKVLHLVN